MSLGFDKHRSLEHRPRGYFQGKRVVSRNEIQLWEYNGKATKETGKKWVNAIALEIMFACFLIIAVTGFVFDFKWDMTFKVMFLSCSLILLVLGLQNLIKCHKKLNYEIEMGFGELERQNDSQDDKADNSLSRIRKEEWAGKKLTENIEMTSKRRGGFARFIALFAFLFVFLGFCFAFIAVWNFLK